MSHQKPLGLRSFSAVMFLTLVLCTFGAVALPHDPYIRYQAMTGTIFERARWIYERIHFDDTPLDIVFIGSSRTARGVISPDIEAALAGAGMPRHIANFSLPASGFDIRFSLAREALENRKVELLVISLVEQFPREGHQAFKDIAAPHDILTAPLGMNRKVPGNILRLPMRQMYLSLASLAPDAFGYRAEFEPAQYAGSSIDPRIFNPGTDTGPQTDEDIATLERQSQFRRNDLTPPLLPELLADFEFGVARGAIRDIAALAKAQDTQLAFLYLPFYGGFAEPAERDWLEQFGPVLVMDQLADDPHNYNDVAHASARGADQITEWLSPRIIEILQRKAR